VYPQFGANFSSRFSSREAAKNAKENAFYRITADSSKSLRLRFSASPREIPRAPLSPRSLSLTADAPSTGDARIHDYAAALHTAQSET
jgi:hypothetical protein